MTAEPWLVRPALADDAAALAALRWEFRTALGRAEEDQQTFIARCAAWMGERLASGRWLAWLIADGDAILGQLWLQPIEKIPNPVAERERHAYLSNLYVRPSARGGAGSALLAAALAWCRLNQVDAAVLWPTPRSRALYARHGFASGAALMELVLGGHDLGGTA